MISQLQELLDRAKLDISRASLGVWIALINVAIVVLVVGGISISAIGARSRLSIAMRALCSPPNRCATPRFTCS